MKGRFLLLTMALLALLPAPARPQTVPLHLPPLTDEQKWNRLEDHWASLLAAAVAYAKSKGDDAEALDHFIGKFFVPSWGDTLSPVGLIRGLYRNGAAWKDFQLQVVTATDTSVTVRFNRPWVRSFSTTGNHLGLTSEDMDRFVRIHYEELATAHGLTYEQHRDGDYLVATVHRR